jgi:hypothetical protein
MHPPFFPLSSEDEILDRIARVAEEFHIYEENMLVSRLMYLSDKAIEIRRLKVKAVESKAVYIGS